MKMSVICFTDRGSGLALRIRQVIGEQFHITLYEKRKNRIEKSTGQIKESVIRPCEGSVCAWAGRQFEQGSAILFIGACGIAVRAIAPWLKDKLLDVPVLVADEAGCYVIPILSGHYGGANELAKIIADALGAEAVITTATDINHRFAVDVFAKKNRLHICNKDGIKCVSAAVLAGKAVQIIGRSGYTGRLPERVCYVPKEALAEAAGEEKATILISPYRSSLRVDLTLCPKALVIGIGCRKGKSRQELACFLEQQLQRLWIRPEAIAAIASIDEKREETGLCELAVQYGVAFLTFSKERLQAMQGTFHGSAFVTAQMGVDNVCERAALAACQGAGRLILPKTVQQGMTIAIAEQDWSVNFEEA